MVAAAPRRTGVFVVRAWLEEERPGALRARITSTLDVSRRDVAVSTASKAEEIERAVRAWLDELSRMTSR